MVANVLPKTCSGFVPNKLMALFPCRSAEQISFVARLEKKDVAGRLFTCIRQLFVEVWLFSVSLLWEKIILVASSCIRGDDYYFKKYDLFSYIINFLAIQEP